MACVWSESKSGEWSACLLESGAPAYLLGGEAEGAVRPASEDVEEASIEGPLLVKSENAKRIGVTWALLCGAGNGVRVNGKPVPGSLRVLRDRDEIRSPALGTIFFTEDTRPVVRPLPKMEGEVVCARCKQAIREGSPAVSCPGCGKWHHQIEGIGKDEDLPCWTYGQACGFCGHPTSLEVGFRWTPEGL
jgi:hypothetical protein